VLKEGWYPLQGCSPLFAAKPQNKTELFQQSAWMLGFGRVCSCLFCKKRSPKCFHTTQIRSYYIQMIDKMIEIQFCSCHCCSYPTNTGKGKRHTKKKIKNKNNHNNNLKSKTTWTLATKIKN
jgi:hypothetical protein